MLLQARERLLFIGDSITDCGRKRPVGVGPAEHALGDGFVHLIDCALTATYPDFCLELVNMGVAGDTVRDLKARWRTDVLEHRPDWLTVFIGINDVWQQCGPLWDVGGAISSSEYADTLGDLIRQVGGSTRGLVLMTPYVLEAGREDPMRAMMDEFGAVVERIAAARGALLVDTQAAFDRLLRWLSPHRLAPDRIHVNRIGHMVLARAWLQAIGQDWDR